MKYGKNFDNLFVVVLYENMQSKIPLEMKKVGAIGCYLNGYRCQIKEISGDKATVFDVDFGMKFQVLLRDIYNLPMNESISILPCVVNCRLNGVIPKEGKWSKEALQLWWSKVHGKEVMAVFLGYDSDSEIYDVNLFANGESLAEILAEYIEKK